METFPENRNRNRNRRSKLRKLYCYEEPLLNNNSPQCCCTNQNFEKKQRSGSNYRNRQYLCECCMDCPHCLHMNELRGINEKPKKCVCSRVCNILCKKGKKDNRNPRRLHYVQDSSSFSSISDYEYPKGHYKRGLKEKRSQVGFYDGDFDECCCCCSCRCDTVPACVQTEYNQLPKACTTQTENIRRNRKCCKCCRGKCGRTENQPKVRIVKAESTQHEEPVKLETNTWESWRKSFLPQYTQNPLFLNRDFKSPCCPTNCTYFNDIGLSSSRLTRLLSKYSLDDIEKAITVLEKQDNVEESKLIKSSKVVKDVLNNYKGISNSGNSGNRQAKFGTLEETLHENYNDGIPSGSQFEQPTESSKNECVNLAATPPGNSFRLIVRSIKENSDKKNKDSA